jgi:hypothetical protein
VQEQDIFIGKYKTRVSAGSNDASAEKEKPPTAESDLRPEARRSWLKRYLGKLFLIEDLDFEKFQKLEAKRPRHEIDKDQNPTCL